MSQIFSIVYRPGKSVKKPPYRYNRVSVDEAELIAKRGIKGDKKAGKHPDRALNIMSRETLEALRAEGFKTNPGEMGEQIIIEGLDINSLSEGDRLQFGESACVEIVSPRTGCDWFEKIQQKSRKDAAGRMGMMARVIEGGSIRVGDAVKVLETVK